MSRRPTPNQGFSVLFEQLRIARGWTPAELARRLDASPTQISRWRKGQGVPSIRALEEIGALFGVDVQQLARLAGYLGNNIAVEQDTIDPEISALMDAERNVTHEELRDIPPVFWRPIIAARRAATRAAIETARAANELISKAGCGELAALADPRAEKEQRRPDGNNGTFTSVLLAAALG